MSCVFNKCINESYRKKGICTFKTGSDGLPLMCVGSWIKAKHYYLENYLNLFIRAMTKKWQGNLNYIDLFCGIGKSRIRINGEEVDGSPLIAMKYNFAKYIFVDKNNIQILKKRCKSLASFEKGIFIKADCNKIIREIRNHIPQRSLSVVFIDPFNLDFNFSSYYELTKNRKMDLIINFPLGIIKRIYNKDKADKKLDTFLGGNEWRDKIIRKPTNYFIKFFKDKLECIGYKIPKEFELLGDVVVKNTLNVPLYYLLFASKDDLGAKFWRKIRKYDPIGQQSLF